MKMLRFLPAFCLIVPLLIMAAAPMVQTEPPPPGLDAAWLIFIALTGWPAFLVALVNLGKVVKIVKDGTAGTWFYVLNGIAFAGVAVLVFMGRLDILNGIDIALGNAARVVAEIVILLGGLTGAQAAGKFINNGVRGTPLIGHSFSNG